MSAAPRLTGRVVENLDLIHALEREDGATVAAVAASVERDPSNVAKALARLAEDGMVHPDRRTELTEAGRAVRAALSADGELIAPAAEARTIRWSQIDRDPDNERRFDPDNPDDVADVNALRESIILRGLLQPIALTAEADGRFMLVWGENRWRAVGWAIAEGDLPADWPIAHRLLPAMEPLQRALARMAENLQRADLHWLDEASGYLRLRERFAQSDDEIADQVGRSKKHVQDYMRVLSSLEDEERRRARLPKDMAEHLTYKRAREAMQAVNAKPREAFELAPADALAVLELADRAQRRSSRHGMFPGTKGWTEILGVDLDATPEAADLAERGLIEFAAPEWAAGSYARLPNRPDLQYWLVERGYPDNFTAALWNARAETVGALEAGRLVKEGLYATDWLNAVQAQPEAAPEPNPVHAGSADPSTPGEGQDPIPAPPHSPAPESAPSSLPAAARTPSDPSPTTPGSETPASALIPSTQATLPDLSSLAAAAMRDVAHAIATGAQDGPQAAYQGAPCWNYFNDAAASQLLHARLVKFQPAANRRDFLVCLTDFGAGWIEALPDDTPMGPAPYATAWLNKPTPETAATPSGPLGPMLGDDFGRQLREATGDEALADGPDLSLTGQIAFCESWIASGMAALGGDPDDTAMFTAILTSLQTLAAT